MNKNYIKEMENAADDVLLTCQYQTKLTAESKMLLRAITAVFHYTKAVTEEILESKPISLSLDKADDYFSYTVTPSSRPDPQPGEKYRYFNGGTFEIISSNVTNCASSFKTAEKLVVYKDVDTGEFFAQTYTDFMYPVNPIKYPNCSQYWSFEKI